MAFDVVKAVCFVCGLVAWVVWWARWWERISRSQSPRYRSVPFLAFHALRAWVPLGLLLCGMVLCVFIGEGHDGRVLGIGVLILFGAGLVLFQIAVLLQGVLLRARFRYLSERLAEPPQPPSHADISEDERDS